MLCAANLRLAPLTRSPHADRDEGETRHTHTRTGVGGFPFSSCLPCPPLPCVSSTYTHRSLLPSHFSCLGGGALAEDGGGGGGGWMEGGRARGVPSRLEGNTEAKRKQAPAPFGGKTVGSHTHSRGLPRLGAPSGVTVTHRHQHTQTHAQAHGHLAARIEKKEEGQRKSKHQQRGRRTHAARRD